MRERIFTSGVFSQAGFQGPGKLANKGFFKHVTVTSGHHVDDYTTGSKLSPVQVWLVSSKQRPCSGPEKGQPPGIGLWVVVPERLVVSTKHSMVRRGQGRDPEHSPDV